MKTLSELTDFYYKTLHPILSDLEVRRIALKKKILLFGGFLIAFSLFIASLFLSSGVDINALIFLGFASVFLGGVLYKWLTKDYVKDFKYQIIRPLIKEIDTNLNYTPSRHINPAYYTDSGIFTRTPDRVSGNDYVQGKVNGVKIEFSDFHAEKKHTNSKGKTSWSTEFQGLFIISDFHKNFKGKTVVIPDTAQSSFGEYIGSFLQSNNFSRNDLVKMDNVAFEKEFVVYATDQIEARYILTHTLMEKILAFQSRSKQPLNLSFVGGKIYMALEYNKDLFEPSVFHSLLKYKIAMEYVETLHLAIGIVEELKLNQKLWSKL